MSSLAGCLVSHSHGDHSRAVPDLMKYGVDCYMSRATADETGFNGHRLRVIEPLNPFRIGTWTVLPFDTVHDVSNLGFLLVNGDVRILYLTDTAFCRYRFNGLTHVLIEANFSHEILRQNLHDGHFPMAHYVRVLKNHMSLRQAIETMKANDLSQVQEIHLLHLSDGNSDEAAFKAAVQRQCGKPVYVAGR